MASGGSLVKSQRFDAPKGTPKYVVEGLKAIGTCEWVLNDRRKKVSNPAVQWYFEKAAGIKNADTIGIPWCAYFTGGELEDAGIPCTRSGMARSYLKWGNEVWKKGTQQDDSLWKIGDIVVFMRGSKDDGVLGHVGFLLSWDATFVYVLGGNQGDKVCIEAFRRSRIIGIRRPKSLFASKTMQAGAGATTSEATKGAVGILVPDAKADVLAQPLQAVPTHSTPVDGVAVETGHQILPDPDLIQSQVDQTKPFLEQLATIKPWVMGVLTVITFACIAYGMYYRYKAHKEGI